jgi:hypothetical protein
MCPTHNNTNSSRSSGRQFAAVPLPAEAAWAAVAVFEAGGALLPQ